MALTPESQKALMDILKVKQPESIAAPIQPKIGTNPLTEAYYNYIEGDTLAQQVSGGDPLKKLLRFASEFVPGINTELAQRRGDKVGEALSYLDALPAASLPIKAGANVATRLQRAKDMGFDIENPVYHGSGADIKAFRLPSKETGQTRTADTGIFFSDSPRVAASYNKRTSDTVGPSVYPVVTKNKDYLKIKPTEKGMLWSQLDVDKLNVEFPDGGVKKASEVFNIDPNSSITTDELAQLSKKINNKGLIIKDVVDTGVGNTARFIDATDYLNKLGYKAVLPETSEEARRINAKIPEEKMQEAMEYASKMMDKPSDITVAFDPSTVRSQFAQFDPTKASSGNLLSGVGGLSLLAVDPQE